MLHKLIGSQAIRTTHLGVAALSMVTHAGLIAVAAVSSGNPRDYGAVSRDTNLERITYTVPTRLHDRSVAAASSRAHRAGRPARGKAWALPDLSKLQPIDVPKEVLGVPDIDALSPSAEEIDWTQEGYAWTDSSSLIAAAPMSLDAVYNESLVERTVFPRRNNPTPRYPEQLRSRGIDGSFSVTFIVDTTGRVEAASIAFPTAMHELFAQSVRRTLMRSRYHPAEVSAHIVRQLVRQEFTFRLLKG